MQTTLLNHCLTSSNNCISGKKKNKTKQYTHTYSLCARLKSMHLKPGPEVILPDSGELDWCWTGLNWTGKIKLDRNEIVVLNTPHWARHHEARVGPACVELDNIGLLCWLSPHQPALHKPSKGLEIQNEVCRVVDEPPSPLIATCWR